jgi:hypothetical protein
VAIHLGAAPEQPAQRGKRRCRVWANEMLSAQTFEMINPEVTGFRRDEENAKQIALMNPRRAVARGLSPAP